MSSLCQQQKLKCTGTETLTTYRGPAMSVEGTLRQVISQAGGRHRHQLRVLALVRRRRDSDCLPGTCAQGNRSGSDSARAGADTAAAIAFPAFPRQPSTQAGPPPAGPQSQLIEPEAMPDPEAQPTTVDPEQAKRSERAAAMLSTGSGNPSNNVLPFPDAQGTPIPISNTPATMLPFPDQFGNPIRVKPGAVGSPFPMKGTGSNTGNAGTETKQ